MSKSFRCDRFIIYISAVFAYKPAFMPYSPCITVIVNGFYFLYFRLVNAFKIHAFEF